MAVTVLGLAGSWRRQGNTETLLDWCLDAAREAGADVRKFRLCEMELAPCRGCGGCSRNGACVMRDGMDALYPHLHQANSVVLAAPVYHMGMPATPKAMIDRSQPFWAIKYVLKRQVSVPGGLPRLGAFLSCAGTEYDDVFDGTTQVVRAWWHILELQPAGELLCRGVDEMGAVAKDPAMKEAAAEIGRRLAERR